MTSRQHIPSAPILKPHSLQLPLAVVHLPRLQLAATSPTGEVYPAAQPTLQDELLFASAPGLQVEDV